MHQAQLLPAFGIDTQILFYDFTFNYVKYPSRWKPKYVRERVGGIPIHRVEHVTIPKKYIRLHLKSLKKKFLHYFEKVLIEFRPEVIHAHTFFGILAADIIHRKHKIPWVATEHSSGFTIPNGYSSSEIELYKKALASCSGYYVVSNFLKQHIARRLDMNQIKIIPNFIDQRIFNCSNQDQGGSKFRFGFVGELKKSKGIFDLVNAFIQYLKNFPDDELIVVGGGNEEKNLDRLINRHQLGQNIKIYGSIDHVSIPKVLNRCQCFVLPSHKETFSIATIEALAFGLPSIVSECGGPAEYFEETMGYTFAVKDTKALEQHMYSIKSQIDRFDRKKISKKILSTYSADQVIPRLKAVYRSLI